MLHLLHMLVWLAFAHCASPRRPPPLPPYSLAPPADSREFYDACDPKRENLCLYGHPDGNWRCGRIGRPAS